MTVLARIETATDHAYAAKKELDAAFEPDPVEQRRCLVRAAGHYRRATDELDDDGGITK